MKHPVEAPAVNKLSDHLLRLLASSPPQEIVTIHVLLKRGLSHQEADHALSQIKELANNQDSIDYLALSDMILCDVKFESIREIDKLSQVVWIDTESEAPLETLLDARE
jgi:hypothetical protein